MPTHAVATAGAYRQVAGGWTVWAPEQGASTKSCSRRGRLGSLAYGRLNHLAFAELRRRLLGTPAPTRDDFYAHPQRGSSPASQGPGTAVTCSSLPVAAGFLRSESPSLLTDVNVSLSAEHRAPPSVGDPGAALPDCPSGWKQVAQPRRNYRAR